MKKLLCVALVGIVCAAASTAGLAQGVGLAERRAITDYEKDVWPKYEREIQDLAGFPVAIILDAKTLALPGLADSYSSDDYLRKPIIDPLLQAIGTITVTEIGRTALKDGLRSIVIHYDETTAPSSNYRGGVKMENGVLTINWKPNSNIDDVEPRASALLSVIESSI